MNTLEYILLGLLVTITMSIWVFTNILRRAPDAFENELGFQLGIAPPVNSLKTLPGFIPTPSPAEAAPEPTIVAPRRPPGSKPPMLPANLTAADFATGAPWRMPLPTEATPPATSDSQANSPAPVSDSSNPPAQQ